MDTKVITTTLTCLTISINQLGYNSMLPVSMWFSLFLEMSVWGRIGPVGWSWFSTTNDSILEILGALWRCDQIVFSIKKREDDVPWMLRYCWDKKMMTPSQKLPYLRNRWTKSGEWGFNMTLLTMEIERKKDLSNSSKIDQDQTMTS